MKEHFLLSSGPPNEQLKMKGKNSSMNGSWRQKVLLSLKTGLHASAFVALFRCIPLALHPVWSPLKVGAQAILSETRVGVSVEFPAHYVLAIAFHKCLIFGRTSKGNVFLWAD